HWPQAWTESGKSGVGLEGFCSFLGFVIQFLPRGVTRGHNDTSWREVAPTSIVVPRVVPPREVRKNVPYFPTSTDFKSKGLLILGSWDRSPPPSFGFPAEMRAKQMRDLNKVAR